MADRRRVPTDDTELVEDLMRLKPDGLSPNGWAALAGVSRTVWSDMRRHGNPSRKTLEKLLGAAGSSLAEFEALRVGGEVRTVADRGKLGERSPGAWRGAPPSPIRLLKTSPAGWWGNADDQIAQVAIEGEGSADTVARPSSLTGDRNAYALTVAEDSMWPRFRIGRRLIVSPAADVAAGDDVVVRLKGDGGHALIKEFVRSFSGEVALRQYNPDITFLVPLDDISAIEKIAGEAI